MAQVLPAQPEANSPAAQTPAALAEQYFDQAYFKYAPTNGTLAGFHQYDTQLEDYTRAGVDAEVATLHEFEKKFAEFPASQLDVTNQDDLELLLSNIRGQLLALETIRQWEKNPDNYSSGISNSIFSLMERKFAPSDERLKSVIARERQIPAVFVAAQQNLKNPPHICATEIALQQIPDIISFFQNDVPAAFTDATDPTVKADFAKSNAAVIAALQEYEKWMKSDLLPRSNGDFRIGADVFSKKLLYDEMVDTPLNRLLEIGYADLHKNQKPSSKASRRKSTRQRHRRTSLPNLAPFTPLLIICCNRFTTSSMG